jgi:hypothetical protein
MQAGTSGNLPAALVTLGDAPLAMAALHDPDPAHIIGVRRQGCPEVAQVLRPYTAACGRNAFESDSLVGGGAAQAVRACKCPFIGHLYHIALLHYIRTTYVIHAQRCGNSFVL